MSSRESKYLSLALRETTEDRKKVQMKKRRLNRASRWATKWRDAADGKRAEKTEI